MIQLLVVLVVLGVVLYLVNAYVPMAAPIKTIVNVIAVLMVCLYLLDFFGVTNWGGHRGRRGW